MSIEFSFQRPGGTDVGPKRIVHPGEKKVLLKSHDPFSDPPRLVAFEGVCNEKNTGGEFLEHILKPHQLSEFDQGDLDGEEILDTQNREILNGEAGQWDLDNHLRVVFRHSTGLQIELPAMFYE